MRNCSHKVSAVTVIFCAATVSAVAQKKPEIKSQVETRVEKLSFPVTYQFSRSVRTGRLVKAQEGREGVLKRTFRITYKDGKPVGKELLKVDKREPVPAVFLMSRSGFQTDRSGFSRGNVQTMVATGYSAMVTGSGRTSMGYRAGFGHVAVDPHKIKLGSLLYVEGYGFAIASDTGGAIRGNRIDLCFPDRRTAARFGHKKVKVHLLKRA